jgi:ABC-type Zn uptake system ZnuABC Zn-binding protein ZnuA
MGVWGGFAVAAPLKVVTTTPDLADIVRQVGGDAVTVDCLSRGYQDPHFVEAKPSLILKLRNADLFIQTGLELEVGWAPLLVQGARNPRIQAGARGYLDASVFIQPLEVPVNPTRSGGDVHPGGNPHYLADPHNVQLVARGIATKFGELDPVRAGDYVRRADGYVKRLDAKIAEWEGALAPYKGTPFVSYHKNLVYFADHFGLVSVGEIEPKPGIPPSPNHTAELIALMKSRNVRLILTMPHYERRTPDALARATGAQVVSVALVPEAVPEATDIIAAVDGNVKAVLSALK